MRRLKGILVLILLLVLLASPIAVLASDISGAQYYGTIIVTNNSTAASAVAVNCTISTQALIDGDYLNSSANNCVIRSSAGADLPFMPSVNASYPWCIWVPSIGQDASTADILYTANSTGGKIRYFPGDNMTSLDSASLELGDNFTIEQSGWINTDNGTDKNLIIKDGAFRTFISPTVGGNITSRVGIEDDDYLDFVATNNDWVQVLDHNDFSFTDGNDLPFTLIAWVNFDAGATTKIIVAKYTGGGNLREWQFGKLNTGVLYAQAIHSDDGGIAIGRNTGNIDAYDGTWIHLAATYDGSETSAGFNIYLNGADIDTGDQAAGAYTGMTNTNSDLEIGSNNAGTGGHMNGGIAEVKIYAGELTPTQILADYSGGESVTNLNGYWKIDEGAGNPTDSSGKGHDANANTADWASGLPMDIRSPSVSATDLSSGEYIITTVVTQGEAGTVDYVQTGDTTFRDVFTANWYGESFTASKGYALDTVSIKAYRVGSPGIVTLSIRDSDANGFPTGADLTSATANASTWTTAAAGVWYSFDVTDMGIYGGTQYAIAFRAPSGDGTNKVRWRMVDADNYAGGRASLSGNSGVDWTSQGAREFTFRTYETASFRIDVDGVTEDIAVVSVNVTSNANNWTYYQNMDDYWEYTEISVNGTQVQYIDWEYDTTFQDSSGFDNDATPTFRTTSSDADVSAVFTSFLPISEAKAPGYALEDAPAFIETVPTIVSEWDVTPPAGTFPLAGVITAVANATDTPAQLPLLIIAGFVIIACSLTASATMRRFGSGSLIAKSAVITAIMGIFIGIGNFGIDFWMLFVFLVIAIALSMGSKQVGWQ